MIVVRLNPCMSPLPSLLLMEVVDVCLFETNSEN